MPVSMQGKKVLHRIALGGWRVPSDPINARARGMLAWPIRAQDNRFATPRSRSRALRRWSCVSKGRSVRAYLRSFFVQLLDTHNDVIDLDLPFGRPVSHLRMHGIAHLLQLCDGCLPSGIEARVVMPRRLVAFVLDHPVGSHTTRSKSNAAAERQRQKRQQEQAVDDGEAAVLKVHVQRSFSA